MNDVVPSTETHCPSCRAPVAGHRDECAVCGIIFAKAHSASPGVPSALRISPEESTSALAGSSLRASFMALLGVIVFFAVTFGLWAALAYLGFSTGVLAICGIAPACWAFMCG